MCFPLFSLDFFGGEFLLFLFPLLLKMMVSCKLKKNLSFSCINFRFIYLGDIFLS